MSYKAIVATIRTRPIEGRDRIVIGTCCSYQVITSADTKDGELGVFFEAGGQLSEEICQVNDLIRRKDESGKQINSGYFEPNRRVQAIRMAGLRSEGFWMPLFGDVVDGVKIPGCLDYTGYDVSTLKEGDCFEELNGHEICKKYYSPATIRAMNREGKQKQTKRRNSMFHEHQDTEPLRRHLKEIPQGALIVLTEKIHGTSHRIGQVLDTVEIPETKWQKLLRGSYNTLLCGLHWCGFFNDVSKSKPQFKSAPTKKEWVVLNGSRRVILEWRDQTNSYYGTDDFRKHALTAVAPHKGEMIYGEIVGFTETGRPIMDVHDIQDKDVKKQYGEKMTYAYGQPEGTCRFYIYRITRVDEDGNEVDLGWFETVKRARQLGIPMVPFIEAFVFNDGDHEQLFEHIDRLVNGKSGSEALPSRLDPRHMQEGVVIRVESERGTECYKHKSFQFGVAEGYLKADDQLVDLVEVS